MTELQRKVARSGAWLFFAAMLTGGVAAFALSGKLPVSEPSKLLGAHLTGLFGGLWCFALSWTLPSLSLSDRKRRAVAMLTILAAWSNWLLGIAKSLAGVSGLDFAASTGDAVMSGLLNVFVVAPTLVATALWAWGLRGRLPFRAEHT